MGRAGGRLGGVIDDGAKDFLHGRLKTVREALVWKLDGLREYDVRRPLTVTGTNLLGLVKHLATQEAWYFGEVFGRPSPEPLGRWQDADGSDLWVTPEETREQIIGFYRRAAEHADVTIGELSLGAPGHVPWWPEPGVTIRRLGRRTARRWSRRRAGRFSFDQGRLRSGGRPTTVATCGFRALRIRAPSDFAGIGRGGSWWRSPSGAGGHRSGWPS
jgi:hypothetical protein